MASFPNILIFNGKRYPFNPHQIVFSSPKPSGHGGYHVKQEYLLKDDKGKQIKVPIVVQTPVMHSQWGLSEKEYDGKTNASLDLRFDKDSKECEQFHDVMILWDAVIVETAIKNKSSWFKDSRLTNEILQYLYHPMVKKNISEKDGVRREYPDSLRLKIQKRYGRYECDVFDQDKKPTTLQAIKADSSMQSLFSNTGLWFSSKSFTSSNRALQVKTCASHKITGCGFLDEEEEETDQTKVESPQMLDEEKDSTMETASNGNCSG
jgi:hypothetical protein